MQKKYKIFLNPKKKKNFLVTIAIGKKYFKNWEEYSKKNWITYCKKYSLGLIVITDHLIDKKHKFWKKPTWQKLLIGSFLNTNLKNNTIQNLCYLDTDILINPLAPNIFEMWKKNKIGVVSMRNNIPYDYIQVRKYIAFYRNKYYSKKYPLDSALFISIKDLYKFHNLPVQKDECCAGLFLFNINKHADRMKNWFFKYDKNTVSITNGGDQTHFNYHIQNEKLDFWLDYRFQASWNYEMAWNYPFLYRKDNSKKIIKDCIETTLTRNYFLHFAGNWPESKMWKTKNLLDDKKNKNLLKKLNIYSKKKLSGKPIGFIKP